MSDELKTLFREGAHEYLTELEEALLKLGEDPGNMSEIDRIFRVMHTIKGSSGMVGFDELQKFSHHLESEFDNLRMGNIRVTKELIDISLQARDLMFRMIEAPFGGEAPEPKKAEEILRDFRNACKSVGEDPRKAVQEQALKMFTELRDHLRKLEADLQNPFPGGQVARSIGEIRALSREKGLQSVEEFLSDFERAYQDIASGKFIAIPGLPELTHRALDEATKMMEDSFAPETESQMDPQSLLAALKRPIEIRETLKKVVAVLPKPGETPPKVQLIGQILLERGDVTTDDLQKTIKEQKPIGERLVERGATTPEKIASALAEQSRQKEAREQHLRLEPSAANIRVSSFKLDKLVNLIGELVTVQERLSQVSAILRESPPEDTPRVLRQYDLSGISEEVNRLTNGLRDNALSIRMLPIEGTFSKFKRLVHDLAGNLGKEIELTMSGAETEIDKTVIDRLDEPLMHLIRNAADHGIEAPEERLDAGKPSKGTIHLSAEHVGGNVVIRVQDDGKGLDKEKILKKARERNLIGSDVELPEKEIYAFIFHPGFSTADIVTNVSGRGVGMDVVKKTIEDLRGSVDVSSQPGKGTNVEITLPLTLAIIDGLLVSVGRQNFILPLSAVEECVELRRTQKDVDSEKKLTQVRGALVPYIPLRDRFSITDSRPTIEQIVISTIGGQRVGFVVDSVIGEHKTVIKPLGKIYKKVPECSGATILGDGSIAIILDLGRIVKYEAEHSKI